MMGKIIGIGAVGLTQLILWIILIFLISTAAFTFLPHDILQQVKDIQSNPGVMTSNPGQFSAAAKGLANLTNLNWPLIVGFFLFYFIGGYLFYSALFAAVGSVINEDPQEAQSLMFPIMMPIVFGFIIMSTNIDKPDSPVMVWASIIPIYITDRYDGKISLLSTILATRRFNDIIDSRFYFYNMGRCKDLSYGYFALW
jgi:ABC-2 type transport system permease protein